MFPAQPAARFHFIGRQKLLAAAAARQGVGRAQPRRCRAAAARRRARVLSSVPNVPASPLDELHDRRGQRGHLRMSSKDGGDGADERCCFAAACTSTWTACIRCWHDARRDARARSGGQSAWNSASARSDDAPRWRWSASARAASCAACRCRRSEHHQGVGRKRMRRRDRLDRRRPRDPDIGRVLSAIHLEPSRNWTVEALARVMGASRSGFAERFATIVGETPARYLTQVRMHQARQWLVRDRLKISVVARGWATNRRPRSVGRSSASSGLRRATSGLLRTARQRKSSARLHAVSAANIGPPR